MLKSLLIFAAGVVIGSEATWKLTKDKYKAIADEEIESVKETFAKRKKKEDIETPTLLDVSSMHPKFSDADLKKLKQTITTNGYRNYSNIAKEEEPIMAKPYVISPEEFGEADYPTESLTYYADGILTDERNDIIEDVERMVGMESLNHFGEYEDDSVFVRNDELRTDYEILLDNQRFYDTDGTED